MNGRGPQEWKWQNNGRILDMPDGIIVLVSACDIEPGHRTIIAAAPETKAQRDELLAALMELEKWTESYSVPSGVTIEEEAKHFNPKFYAAMLQARAAIARAKGE